MPYRRRLFISAIERDWAGTRRRMPYCTGALLRTDCRLRCRDELVVYYLLVLPA